VRYRPLNSGSTDQPDSERSAQGDIATMPAAVRDRHCGSQGQRESQAPARAVACEHDGAGGHALLEQMAIDIDAVADGGREGEFGRKPVGHRERRRLARLRQARDEARWVCGEPAM